MLLAIVTATARYLKPPEHRSLFDRVSAYFGRFHHVTLPYRVTLRLPLLTRALKQALRCEIDTAFQSFDFWPPPLRRYLADRVVLVNCKLRAVGDRLLTRCLDSYPTSTLEPSQPATCPCHAWASCHGVRFLHGHAFFRDPHVLPRLSPGLDSAVFSQNFKNATVPSWSRFEADLHANPNLQSGVTLSCPARPQEGLLRFPPVHPHAVMSRFLRKQTYPVSPLCLWPARFNPKEAAAIDHDCFSVR